MTSESPALPGVEIGSPLEADLEPMRLIYAREVEQGTASFELAPPDGADFARRCRTVLDAGLPWLVAKRDEQVLGYAYAGVYRPRPAYRFTVEDSVYVHPAARGQGLGRALLAAVVDEATRAGRRQMVAVVGDSANTGSIALHEALGFRRVGTFENVGFKFGRWLDTVLLQRPLGEGASRPPQD
ncbi:GNAT family N-acetyltransferase [Aquibaculum arenosum]|uniref:GNAT family N-acetyltransferase n=1 Tax=Aquibaculum arenosum TaxID=3032591 RepID=A0ABT5YHP7_9PROT|nr:GNAT family N-acetyltransferase [Fodinicurvata sp. CAU 1616]MDF2094461.1 GNAT family N-acetyltransferase [Fodinicurvata sp. CAU 1616]